MTRSRLAFGLSLLVLGLVWSLTSAAAQQQPRPPSQQFSVQASAAVSIHNLPSIDVEALRAEDKQRKQKALPHRYGTTVDTDLRPSRNGTWEQLSSEKWLWRLRIQSQDAVSLSVGFTRFQLPSEAKIFLHGPGNTAVHGPYTAKDATNGQHWTPLIHAEEIVIELTVPAKQRSAVNLTIGKVIHGYRSLTSSREGPSTKSGDCNIDVACDQADPWRDQVRSVGGYTLRRGQNALWCTGTLVNNTAEDKTPYFLTAEHCVAYPSQASSMVFYWNFQTAQCREPGSGASGTFPDDSLTVGKWEQTSTGAILKARYGSIHEDRTISGKPDLALVEIDDDIPVDYNLFFSGWSRERTTTSSSVTIHHPSGHGKRITFDENPSSITGWGRSSSGNTHLRIGNWERGTTEGGSSGSPLFNTEKRVVGVLSGGSAGCDIDTQGSEDNNRPDWYGRLALGFENGDYQGATLADFLDPTDSGAMAIDGQNLISDSRPPARARNFRVDAVTPDSVTLSWTAPGNDGMSGTAREYLLRYQSDEPITSQSDFNDAQSVSNVPAPKPAGTPQSVTIPVEQGSSYYFALVATDMLNASPLATIERDVTPVPGLRVTTPPYPNPTQGPATLHFVTEESQPIRAELYDALGRRIRVLYDRDPPAFQRQTISVRLDGVSSGIYFVRIRGRNEARTEQISVVK